MALRIPCDDVLHDLGSESFTETRENSYVLGVWGLCSDLFMYWHHDQPFRSVVYDTTIVLKLVKRLGSEFDHADLPRRVVRASRRMVP